MSALTIIAAACEVMRSRGVKLVRGATFDWTSTVQAGLPVSCNALGAVLLVHGLECSKHARKELGHILNENPFYFYRWTIGWDNQHVLSIYDVGKDGVIFEVGKDKVSAEAKALSRRLVG